MMVWRPLLTIALSLSVLGAFACGAPSEDASRPTLTPPPETLAPTAPPETPAPTPPPETPAPAAAATATGASYGDISATYQGESLFVPLDNPVFIAADEAGFLDAGDLVLGLTIGGESRAYPTSMMTYHHIVNDTFGGRPILVTF
ncbi:MAG: DUF3179 domain-containing protein [Chloroflexi bacterium]|nr:DUF3179 domain-containing protein [Chloroflexota bacterium]